MEPTRPRHPHPYWMRGMTPEQKAQFDHFEHEDIAKVIDPEAFKRWETGDGFDRMQVVGRLIAAREKATAIAALTRRALVEAKAEAEMLQDILDSRPAINAGLPGSYVRWSQSIYSGDIVRAALATTDGRPAND